MSAVFSTPRRERWIIAAALAAIAAAAWLYMVHEARGLTVTGVCECFSMEMGGNWAAGTMLPLFLMWAGMMIAMMLPSATPMILTFAAVSRKRRQQQRPYVPVAIFVSGYIAIWTGFSLLAAGAQWFLHRKALISPAMASQSAILAGFLLLAAGIFQFTPLKHACLSGAKARAAHSGWGSSMDSFARAVVGRSWDCSLSQE
jgi:predicted metal-binding membrane protein